MSKREKILMIIAVIVLVFLFGVKRVVLPTIDRFYTVKKEYEETEFELEKAKLQLAGTDKYIKRLKEINNETHLIERLFYNGNLSEVKLEVLKFLDDKIRKLGLASESKALTVERINKNSESMHNEAVTGGNVYTVKEPIKLIYRAQLRGDYLQLLSFLEDIHNYHKYYSVSQLDIKISSDGTQLAAFIVIESYCIEGDKDEDKKV